MKRSEIRKIIEGSMELLKKNNFSLPMFGYWTVGEWRKMKDKLSTIRKTKLGWDVTDYGSGDFRKVGSALFTIRNGDQKDPSVGTPYAEKYILMTDGQELPLHFHWYKVEDIINRAGGVLKIQVFNSLENGEIDYVNDVTVETDGITNTVKAGSFVDVTVGNSITIRPGMYHRFHADGDIVVGEVSKVNDDTTDNRFAEAVPRFSVIDEDEEVVYPLCNEYEKLVFGE